MAKSKKIRLSPLKIAVLLFLVLFLPVAVYVTKQQTQTQSDASGNCQARVYIAPKYRVVNYYNTGKDSVFDVYVTQTQNAKCTYYVSVINVPRGITAEIPLKVAPEPNSTKQITLKVSHKNNVRIGVNDIIVQVQRKGGDRVYYQPEATGSTRYIVDDDDGTRGDD